MAKVEAEVKTRSRPAPKKAIKQAVPSAPRNGSKNGRVGRRWVQQLEPQPLLWTTEEFQRMGDAGVFEGRHVELIEGVIVGLMTMGPRHFVGLQKAMEALRVGFGAGYLVRPQCPLNTSANMDPEPDIAVVPGEIDDYARQHPTSALLIVEVSDTTLAYDRGRKASLYARTGIADYWVSNLIEDQLEVHREPVPQRDAPFGYVYSDVKIYRRGESIAPLAKPDARIAVDDLLPAPDED